MAEIVQYRGECAQIEFILSWLPECANTLAFDTLPFAYVRSVQRVVVYITVGTCWYFVGR